MILLNSKYSNVIRLLLNQHRSLDELTHMQNVALRKLVKHSYNTVKFYKVLFDDCGLKPDDIKSIDDISKIPVIDKKNLTSYSPEDLISNKYKKENLKPINTSGSSGTPLQFFIDNAYDQFRKAQFLRPYLTNKRRPWDKSVYFSVYNTPEKKWFNRFGLLTDNRVYSGLHLDDQIKAIKNIKPAVIQGYSSVLNLLATKIIEENISLPKPKLIFTDSEVLLPEMREKIERAFGTKIIDIYGTFETDNIAYECHYHNGYHIAVDCVIMEFLKDGKPVQEKEEGEIVVTVLNNLAMPFIRYNMHDISSFNNQRCTCGRTFPLMNRITGRSNDYIIMGNGNKLSFINISRYFTKMAPQINEYQVIQQNMNSFLISIVPNKTFRNEDGIAAEQAVRNFLPEADINVKIVSAIERENSGKFKAFKSNVKL